MQEEVRGGWLFLLCSLPRTWGVLQRSHLKQNCNPANELWQRGKPRGALPPPGLRLVRAGPQAAWAALWPAKRSEVPRGVWGRFGGRTAFWQSCLVFTLKPTTCASNQRNGKQTNSKRKELLWARWVVALRDSVLLLRPLRPQAGHRDCGQTEPKQQPIPPIKGKSAQTLPQEKGGERGSLSRLLAPSS